MRPVDQPSDRMATTGEAIPKTGTKTSITPKTTLTEAMVTVRSTTVEETFLFLIRKFVIDWAAARRN